MSHPGAAALAIADEPSVVIAEAARDLAGLDRGVGGPEALHAALAPIKNRADLAIALGELSGAWSVPDATAARVDFAERIVETALRWLTRAAVKRGELAVSDAENFTNGVFVLAGADFAHEDLAPYGPLELVVLYNDEHFADPKQRGADRVFVRIGAELRDAFEGKPGDHQLYALKTPLGTGVGGAGYADSIAHVRATASGPQAQSLKAWLATARVVAGDRTEGGAFLEEVEEIVWDETPVNSKEWRDALKAASDDPRAVFRSVADFCRFCVGGARPILRTASAREVFDIASHARAIAKDAARRLIAGEELAHIVVSRAQMIKGTAAVTVASDDERAALATLCGFADHEALMAALKGAQGDAANTLSRLMRGPHEEIALYRDGDGDNPDADNLEDLGFKNGADLSLAVDEWARRAGATDGARFSAHAPGFLTEVGETQHPDQAVRLFDSLLCNAEDSNDVIGLVREEGSERSALIDGFGCFGDALTPIAESSDAVFILRDGLSAAIPENGDEWLASFAPPSVADEKDVADLAVWRRQSIARIAYFAACGAMSFDAAVSGLDAVHKRALTDTSCAVQQSVDGDLAKAANKIALHLFEGDGVCFPGDATRIGFIASEDLGDHGDGFVRRYLGALNEFGDGLFAINPDLSHRPSGATGPLAPSLDAFRNYVRSEAVAHDQIMLARARVIAGEDKIADDARDALRGAVSGARRADVLFRDLDRARAQRMRRDRPRSEWDIDRIDGGRHDVELVISALIFRHAPAHPFVQEHEASAALEAMARCDLISADAAKTLKFARDFWARLQLARSLARWSDPVEAPVRSRFGAVIARAAGVERFEQVRPLMHGYADDVSRLYSHLVLGRPPLNVVAQAAG